MHKNLNHLQLVINIKNAISVVVGIFVVLNAIPIVVLISVKDAIAVIVIVLVICDAISVIILVFVLDTVTVIVIIFYIKKTIVVVILVSRVDLTITIGVSVSPSGTDAGGEEQQGDEEDEGLHPLIRRDSGNDLRQDWPLTLP